jgi:hypothetical protein
MVVRERERERGSKKETKTPPPSLYQTHTPLSPYRLQEGILCCSSTMLPWCHGAAVGGRDWGGEEGSALLGVGRGEKEASVVAKRGHCCCCCGCWSNSLTHYPKLTLPLDLYHSSTVLYTYRPVVR